MQFVLFIDKIQMVIKDKVRTTEVHMMSHLQMYINVQEYFIIVIPSVPNS